MKRCVASERHQGNEVETQTNSGRFLQRKATQGVLVYRSKISQNQCKITRKIKSSIQKCITVLYIRHTVYHTDKVFVPKGSESLHSHYYCMYHVTY